MTAPRAHSYAPDLTDNRRGWIDDALCTQVPGDLFYPRKGEIAREALTICSRCEVRAECLADALTMEPGQDHGVRGGTTANEHRWIRRRMRGAA